MIRQMHRNLSLGVRPCDMRPLSRFDLSKILLIFHCLGGSLSFTLPRYFDKCKVGHGIS